MIIDGHNRIFPPFDSPAGHPSLEAKMKFIQRQFGGHHIPNWRVRDGALAGRDTLLDPSTYQLRDVQWNSDLGRLNWVHEGEEYTNQYLPPSLENQEATPELLLREMDSAGVDMGVLHPAPLFGRFSEYLLDTVRRFPDRFMTVFNVDDGSISKDPDSAIQEISKYVQPGIICGVQFFSRWYYTEGEEDPWDGPAMLPYWDAVAGMGVPVYFTLYNGGKRVREFQKSSRESYLAEHRTLLRWMERYPDVKVVITHGPPWLTFMEEGPRFVFPEEFWDVFKSPACHLQLAPPIMLGLVMEHPWTESEDSIKECVARIGADRLIWGTDMPLTLRYATYRQSLNQFRVHCAFLSDSERTAILGDTAARVMGLPEHGVGLPTRTQRC